MWYFQSRYAVGQRSPPGQTCKTVTAGNRNETERTVRLVVSLQMHTNFWKSVVDF